MNKIFAAKTIIVIAVATIGLGGSVHADTTKLIGQLVDLLGVSRSQAEGGAGAIFKAAKENMSTGDYSQLLGAVPGIDSLVGSAPESSGLAAKASSLLGSSSDSVKGTAGLADSFSSLGLSPDMVGKYTDIILDYVQSEGGQQAMALLKNALL
ncbi:MAG: DUF2780 domain-containing protein [Desulfobacterales bacterium]